MIRFALSTIAIVAATAAQAQVYKCIGPDGVTTYSQNPCPPNMKRETMQRGSVSAAPAAAPADASGQAAKSDAKSGPKSAADQEQAFRKRQLDAAKAAKEADQQNAQAQLKASNCANAKQRLAQYEIGGRISRVDQNGERYYMDDAQIESEKARARADVASQCN
jgi:hypothetical protein